jgi:hypothetical protein
MAKSFRGDYPSASLHEAMPTLVPADEMGNDANQLKGYG